MNIATNTKSLQSVRDCIERIIRCSIEKHGTIGTFYKNVGVHHSSVEIDVFEEYDEYPIVAICNHSYRDYGGYSGNTVYDLFTDDDDELYATLNGEDGSDFDEPVSNIQVEGLLNIQKWLVKYGFAADDQEIIWRCKECGSSDVDYKRWKDGEYGSELEDQYCNNC